MHPHFQTYMGSCFSSSITTTAGQPTARVVTRDGSLTEYSANVIVSQVLGTDRSFFICNSDSLCYNSYIQALGPDEMLIFGHLYLVLPVSKLQSPLTGPDMAELAVMADSAITSSQKINRRRHCRVMPVPDQLNGFQHEGRDMNVYERFNEMSVGVNLKSGSQRVSGAARLSYTSRMSTIDEVVES